MTEPDLNAPARTLQVGVAECVVVQNENVVLRSHPLGAGLGVAILDPQARLGGLMHCLLPQANIDPERAVLRPAMFVDTGLALLLNRLRELGAAREHMLVYVAGGGRIMDEGACFNIGSRNHAVLLELLSAAGLAVTAGDVGGLANRTLQLGVLTGKVSLKISGRAGETVLCKP